MSDIGNVILTPPVLVGSEDNPYRYLRASSVFDIVRNALRIYLRHFQIMVATLLLPILPFDLVQIFGQGRLPKGWLVATAILTFVVLMPAFCALCIVVSEVCLGNKPSVRRALRRTFGTQLAYMGGNGILQLVCVAAPLLLVVAAVATGNPIVIGIAALVAIVTMVWIILSLLFVPAISTLEPRPGYIAALRRSVMLAKGHRARAAAVLLLQSVISMVIGAVVGFIGGVVIMMTGNVEVFGILMLLLQRLLMPWSLISIVLLYYDVRSRKEGGDMAVVVESLRS